MAELISGTEGKFHWWRGVVEDREDPKKLGRLRVRIYGEDTDSLTDDGIRGIPTESLLWAEVIQPIDSAAMSGIGSTPVGILPGSRVFGFYWDGDMGQLPVVVGSIAGIPTQKADPKVGFNDPSGMYPLQDHLDESDLNRLARHEKIDETIVKNKQDSQLKNISSRSHEFSEPDDPYNAKYPYNKVIETEGGHVIEIDSTPDNERIHVYHKSGTFSEISQDGTEVNKTVSDRYDLTLGNNEVYVKGHTNVVVDGYADVKIGSDAQVKVDGSTTLESSGHVSVICPTATLRETDAEPAILGDTFYRFMQKLIQIFNEHKHIGNVGFETSNPVVLDFEQLWEECRSSTVKVGGPKQ